MIGRVPPAYVSPALFRGRPVTPDEIAKVIHEANRTLTGILRDVPVQQPWEAVPVEMKTLLIRNVVRVLRDSKLTAEQLHHYWVEEKKAAGWRHGPTKDDEAKTHPAMVPWAELPSGVRKKDALFIAIVHALR